MMFLYVAFCKPKSFVQLLPHFWFLYLYVPLWSLPYIYMTLLIGYVI